MVVTCDIQFENNPDGCYYAGQVISGKITLSCDKVHQVKAVNLKIKGFAHNHWDEREYNKSIIYAGHVDYIDTLTCLLTSADGEESISIQPGIHCFNFVCHLPTTCPSSFESHCGHIRYLVMVCLVRPWRFDKKFTRGFTVLEIMNLNYESSLLKMPVSQHINNEFFWGPLKSDPLEMLLQLPRSGFVPGENIPVGVLVTNNTNAKIKEIRLRLVMILCLYSQHPRVHTRNEYTTVSKFLGDPVLPLCKKEFNYLLPVPATPVTSMKACSLMQISYRVEVEAKIKGAFYRNQVVHTAVTIGNVPISNVLQMKPSFSRGGMLKSEFGDEIGSAVVTQKVCNVSNVQPWSENDDTPPPSYMGTSYMPPALLAAAGEHEYGEKKFSPKYPVYNMSSSSTEKQNSDNLESVTATKTETTETNKQTQL